MRTIRSILIPCLLACGAALAAPADDFRAGSEAYRAGDMRKAISILRKAADAGHAPSQALLGDILDLAEQDEEAVKYYRLAADQASPEGLYGLGMMHASGQGVPRDLQAARGYLARAAEAGYGLAVKAMALAYIDGGLALTAEQRASPEALQWIQKAVALDSLPAIDRLAVAYRQGQMGLTADAQRAEELEARARKLRNITPPKGKKGAKANG